MASLRAQNLTKHYATLAKSYSAHRPLIQRIINASFILYVLGSTYRGLSGGGGSSKSSKKKGKGKKEDSTKKSERVAVRTETNFQMTC